MTRGAAVKPRFKVWVVFGRKTKFGDGRAELLGLIGELGSIKKAVGRFGMSYRNAWGYLEELERSAGFKLIERRPGGGRRGGTRLTRKGKKFLERYRRFRQGTAAAVERHFRACFKKR
jgi:molybdate transport system regulatory protein